jgi:MtN3 and saliva related transmembrane protein
MRNLILSHQAKKRRPGKKLFSFADRLIYIAAIVSPLALIPQITKIFTTHEVGGLSLTTWIILSVINIVWLTYGINHRERPIILTNLLSFALNIITVAGILLYR